MSLEYSVVFYVGKHVVCFLLAMVATTRPGGIGLQSQLLRRLRKGDLKFKACLSQGQFSEISNPCLKINKTFEVLG